jgi:hypothetical protein
VGDIGPDQETTESSRYRTQSGPSTAGLAARVAGNWHLLVLGGWTFIWFVILAPHGGISWTFFTTDLRLGLVVAFTAALLLGPGRWYPPTAGARPGKAGPGRRRNFGTGSPPRRTRLGLSPIRPG